MHYHVEVTPKVGDKYTVILDESMISDVDFYSESMEKLKQSFPHGSKIIDWFCADEECPEYHEAQLKNQEKVGFTMAHLIEFNTSLKGEVMPHHDPNDVALVMDIVGRCNHCKKHTTARLVAYYSREVLVRCSQCKTANQFVPDNETYTDGKTFAPFMNDEDDLKPGK